jgi:hypothetical protein
MALVCRSLSFLAPDLVLQHIPYHYQGLSICETGAYVTRNTAMLNNPLAAAAHFPVETLVAVSILLLAPTIHTRSRNSCET